MDNSSIPDAMRSIIDQVQLRREEIRSRMAWIEFRRRELWVRMDVARVEEDGGDPLTPAFGYGIPAAAASPSP